MRRFTLVCDEQQARRVERLAAQYDLTEPEVLHQLIELGFDSLDADEGRTGESEGPTPDD